MSTHLHTPNEATSPASMFRLYVAGEAPNSALALRNLKELCQKCYGNNYSIEVVDVLLSHERAWAEGVIATPTTVRISPLPAVQIIGNLSETDHVLSILRLAGGYRG
jgi:circadian clock protein KaiB